MTNKEQYANYNWIKVKQYNPDIGETIEEKYNLLTDHHLKETTFLINEVRSLANKLDEQTDQTEKAEVELKIAILTIHHVSRRTIGDYFRSFMIYWFGFAMLVALTIDFFIDFFIDKQTQFHYHNWIFGGVILFGLTASLLLTYCKWKRT